MKLSNYPVDGKYGKYGGRFVPEVLMAAINELEEAYEQAREDPSFPEATGRLLGRFCGQTNPALLRGKPDAQAAAAPKSTLNAKTLPTAEHTKSTTRLGRRCWLSGWVRRGLLLRQERGSMAWRRRLLALLWV